MSQSIKHSIIRVCRNGVQLPQHCLTRVKTWSSDCHSFPESIISVWWRLDSFECFIYQLYFRWLMLQSFLLLLSVTSHRVLDHLLYSQDCFLSNRLCSASFITCYQVILLCESVSKGFSLLFFLFFEIKVKSFPVQRGAFNNKVTLQL